MNDLLERLALLDPVDEADALADAQAVHAEVRARIDAAPTPAAPRRWARSRRAQALLAACLAVALVAVALAAIRAGTSAPPTGRTEDGWLVVGSLDALKAAEVTYVEAARTFVIAPSGDEPYALSAVSPHSTYGYEELLFFCRPSGTFVELAHGDKYDIAGQYAVGPSPSGMYGVPLRIVDGEVAIDPATLLPGAPKGSEPLVDYELCPAEARWSEPGFLDVGGTGNDLMEMTFFHADGQDVTAGTFVSTVRGSNCGFPVPTWLQLTDPLGSEPATDADWRYYVADPDGVWTDRASSTYSQTEPLPQSAEFSGYRSRIFELWRDPANAADEVWIVRSDPNGGSLVQRWPRVELPPCDPFASQAPTPSPTSPPGGGEPSTSLSAENIGFDTEVLTFAADTSTTLRFENDDRGVPHRLSIYEDDTWTTSLFTGEIIVGRSSVDYEIPGLLAGEYVFRCDIHPTTMSGTVVVS